MYLRKCDGPRTVTLPGGEVLSMADLPPANTRWVASRKAIVVKAVLSNLIEREAAIKRYALTEEELESWIQAAVSSGEAGLRVSAIQKKRHGG